MQSPSLESDDFDVSLYLQQFCKKHDTYYDTAEKERLEIDFLAL